MIFRQTVLVLLALSSPPLHGQNAAGTIPARTPLAIAVDDHYPMRAGAVLRGHLLYPVYADNRLLLPKDAVVTGTVTSLLPDHNRRIHAILGGDFTPFHIPEVRFTTIVLADGKSIPIDTEPASSGTQIYRAVAPPPSKGGFIRREFNSGLTVARDDVALVTAPGRGDRLLQCLYSQIPYHPQRIDKGTSWTVETSSPLEVPAQPAAAVITPPAPHKQHFWENPAPVAQPAAPDSTAWIVEANLADALSSETSAKGQAITAVVAQPIYNPDHSIAVPQGATLLGTVTNAKASRHFGRSGVLSFSFNQLTLPGGAARNVETRLTEADSPQNIALNSEGQAKSKPQDKILLPLILTAAATWSLHRDHEDGGGIGQLKNAAGGAAGLGLVGAVVSLAGGSPNAAAGIGYWGAARAFYSRWIGRGQKITFAKDTRIVVETTPRRSAPMAPAIPPRP